MSKTMIQDGEWQVRICRPAFQDFQRIFQRYYVRSVLNRQLLKLRWWSPGDSLVMDLQWHRVPETNLMQLLVDEDSELPTAMRVLFFEYSPNPAKPTLWVLGGLKMEEEFGETQCLIYASRSSIVQERA